MLKLGIVGTNWISRQFVEAALESGCYTLTGVYSRKIETAEEFASHFSAVTCETNFETFVHLKEVEVVYIASPNSLHFAQAKRVIEAGKHVIVEKPAFSTSREMAEIIQLAKKYDVCYFEAARNIHEVSFQQLQEVLPERDKIIGANFTYMKYSSRYDAVRNGEEPNIFSPHFSGGALMDLGVYLLYAAVALFGMPEKSSYFPSMIQTGVDGMGTILMHYPTFNVMMMTGKISDSFLPSEIYTEDQTLIVNGVNSIENGKIIHRKTKQEEILHFAKLENPMLEEAKAFAEVLLNQHEPEMKKKYEKWRSYSEQVNFLLEKLRIEAGIYFDADQENK